MIQHLIISKKYSLPKTINKIKTHGNYNTLTNKQNPNQKFKTNHIYKNVSMCMYVCMYGPEKCEQGVPIHDGEP